MPYGHGRKKSVKTTLKFLFMILVELCNKANALHLDSFNNMDEKVPIILIIEVPIGSKLLRYNHIIALSGRKKSWLNDRKLQKNWKKTLMGNYKKLKKISIGNCKKKHD